MKHSWKITLFLLALFFASQLIGLFVTSQYIEVKETSYFNETLNETVILKNVTYEDLPYRLERPEVPETLSFIYILIAVLIGTGILLLIIKFKQINLWKIWYFLAIFFALTIALAAFMNSLLALLISLVFSFLKVFKPNLIVQNLTELLIYGGLAAIFVPIMNLLSIIILLVLVSIYDFIAVRKIKHMVTMAKWQTSSNVFAGLFVPYEGFKQPFASFEAAKGKKKEGKTAILGGGDMAFPLLFAGVLLKHYPLIKVLVVPLIVTLSLFFLFIIAKKDKFYPAMPFLTVGCVIGYLVLIII